jgi:hypothetical protein
MGREGKTHIESQEDHYETKAETEGLKRHLARDLARTVNS